MTAKKILFILLSIVAHLGTLALLSSVWCLLISGFGYQVSLAHGFKIAYIANLGRYIPGKIWQVFGMVYYAKQAGVREEAALSSWVIAMAFALPSAFAAGMGIIFVEPQLYQELSRLISPAALIAGGIGVLALSLTFVFLPKAMFWILNQILKRIGRDEVTLDLSIGLAAKIYLAYVLCWLSYGLSFWLLAQGLGLPESSPLPYIGTFVLAYQIGYLAFFAPGGIGIREIAVTSMLTPYLGPLAAGLAIAARIWNTIVEILAALIAVGIRLSDSTDRNRT